MGTYTAKTRTLTARPRSKRLRDTVGGTTVNTGGVDTSGSYLPATAEGDGYNVGHKTNFVQNLRLGTPDSGIDIEFDSSTGAVHVKGGLYADGFISAMGIGSGGSGGGDLNVADLWLELTNGRESDYTNTLIADAHIPNISYTKITGLDGIIKNTISLTTSGSGFLSALSYSAGAFSATFRAIAVADLPNNIPYSKLTGTPTELPASDVQAWAKAATKPEYNLGTDAKITGVLTVAKGGTGKSTGADACNYFLNALSTGSSTPTDADYYISQYVGGGTTTTIYRRRPMSCLWAYIKGKMSSDSAVNIRGNADTATTWKTAQNFKISDYYDHVGAAVSVNGGGAVTLKLPADIEVASIKIGSATLSWDSTASALKVDTGFYSESFVSAMGVGSGSSGGGGGINVADLWLELTNGTGHNADYTNTEIAVAHIPNISYTKITGLDGIIKNTISLTKSGSGFLSALSYSAGVFSATFSAIAVADLPNNIPYSKLTGTPTSLPASDVYSWAKAATKPEYNLGTDAKITGVLTVAKGGTGKSTGADACNYFLNALSTGSSTPTDSDYYISQYVGGGTTTTTYHRRPMSCLWAYIKGKMSSDSAVNISGNAATATSAGKWTSAINISISDADGTNTGTAVSVDGSAAKTLKLPSTIKAALSGNATSATTAKYLWSAAAAPTFGVSRLEYFNAQGTYAAVSASATCYPTSDWYHFLRMNYGNNVGYYVELVSGFHSNNLFWRRTSNGTAYDWRQICMTDKTLIPYPNGGTYRTNTATVTGALKIRLPKKYTSAMMSFWVDIYNYTDNDTVSYYVSGYNYNVDSKWYRCSSFCVGSGTHANLNVRFGDDGTYCCVLIGNVDTTWSYPQIYVRDVQLGYTTVDFTYNTTPWNISFVTTLPTNNQTISTYKHKATSLRITSTTDIGGTTAPTDLTPLVIGSETGQHIEIGGNEILSKSNGTTPSTLYLQDGSGTVEVAGSGGLKVTNGSIYTTGNIIVNSGSTGVYYNGSGIHWHNASNQWTQALLTFNSSYDIIFGNGGGKGAWTSTGLGIGKTTPSYMLDVAGSIQATGDILTANGKSFHAKNTSGTYEQYLWPRYTDNKTYFNYGSAGFHIRTSSSANVIFINSSGQVGIGNTAPSVKLHVTGDIYATGGITASDAASSDRRLKTDIRPFCAMSIVERLKPVQFRWNAIAKKYNSNFDTKLLNYGLIAQDSDGVMDGLVFDLPDSSGYKGVRYEKLVPVLLQAVKEQQQEIDQLKQRLNMN